MDWTAEQKATMEKSAKDDARAEVRDMYPDPSCRKAEEYFERSWRARYRAMAYPP